MIDLECHALSTNYNRRLIEILLHNVAANLDTCSDSHFMEVFGVANKYVASLWTDVLLSLVPD